MSTPRLSSSGWPWLIAKTCIENYLATKPGEEVMILAETEAEPDLVHAFAAAAQNVGAEATIVVMPPSFREVERFITKIARKALEAADIYICMTPTTIHSAHDARVAELMWGEKRFRCLFVPPMIDKIVEAIREHDYEQVYSTGRRVADFMTRGKRVHVTSAQGTDLHASIEGIEYRVAGCLAREPGIIGCIPDGEAFGGPVEGTAEGIIVIDGPIQGVCHVPGGPTPPVRLTVEKGRYTRVEGGVEADKIKRLMEQNENMDNMAEISLGVNPFVHPTGSLYAADKKRLGTMHVAMGQNTMQIYPHGTVESPIHMDMVLQRPTCEVDGTVVLKDGKLHV
jgi:leucyl aminopeptidase (aminopeptidase T)